MKENTINITNSPSNSFIDLDEVIEVGSWVKCIYNSTVSKVEAIDEFGYLTDNGMIADRGDIYLASEAQIEQELKERGKSE